MDDLVVGKNQRGLGAAGIAGFCRGHRFHAIAHLAEPDPLGADCSRIGKGGADRRSVVDHAVALGAGQVDLNAAVLGQGAEIATVARSRDEAGMSREQGGVRQDIGDIAAGGLAGRIPAAGLDDVGARAQVLAGNLGK